MTRYTTYLSFADEAAAVDALGAYRVDGAAWDTSCVDAFGAGAYLVNILSNERKPDLEALPAWIGTAEDRSGQWVLIAGTAPHTPTRAFA